jgi:hypothetical protein
MRALSPRDNLIIARRFNAGDKFIMAQVPEGRLNIARRRREETTVTLTWIASRLNMGTAGSLANLLRNKARRPPYPIMRD